MRREDHGVPARERLDGRADLGDLFRVEADGGFVEDQDLGIAEDRLRESDPLPVALRQPADEPVLDVGDEAALHDLRDPAPTLGAPHALDLGDEVQVRRDAEVPVERDALREVADPPADLQRLAEHVVSRDLRRPARGGHEAGEDAHRRRLPRPVRAEEAHDLARRDAERHVPDRGDRAIMLREALYFDHSRLTDGLYTVTGPARPASTAGGPRKARSAPLSRGPRGRRHCGWPAMGTRSCLSRGPPAPAWVACRRHATPSRPPA